MAPKRYKESAPNDVRQEREPRRYLMLNIVTHYHAIIDLDTFDERTASKRESRKYFLCLNFPHVPGVNNEQVFEIENRRGLEADLATGP
jgi:hypothetical protein